MPSLSELAQMQKEWVAWRIVCQELAAKGIDINTETKLHAALTRWGEEIAELRDYQDIHARTQWLEEKRANANALDLALEEEAGQPA